MGCATDPAGEGDSVGVGVDASDGEGGRRTGRNSGLGERGAMGGLVGQRARRWLGAHGGGEANRDVLAIIPSPWERTLSCQRRREKAYAHQYAAVGDLDRLAGHDRPAVGIGEASTASSKNSVDVIDGRHARPRVIGDEALGDARRLVEGDAVPSGERNGKHASNASSAAPQPRTMRVSSPGSSTAGAMSKIACASVATSRAVAIEFRMASRPNRPRRTMPTTPAVNERAGSSSATPFRTIPRKDSKMPRWMPRVEAAVEHVRADASDSPIANARPRMQGACTVHWQTADQSESE